MCVSPACPAIGSEAGWDLLSGDSADCAAIGDVGAGATCDADARCTYDAASATCGPTYTDCTEGRCPSHDACPVDTFCCLDGSHERCSPPVAGAVTAMDSDDGWKLVFRQVLPSTDRENGGYFLPGEMSRNANDESASEYQSSSVCFCFFCLLSSAFCLLLSTTADHSQLPAGLPCDRAPLA